jgi:general secretion pathway protein M
MSANWLIGRRGQALAVVAPLVLGAIIWFVAVQPLLAWHADQAETISQRTMLAERMVGTAAMLPMLRQQIEDSTGERVPDSSSFAGASDSIAGAMLQERVQGMAMVAGLTLTSVETLTAEPLGVWRRIGLRVVLTAPWPNVIGLLQALDEATPQMLVDDLQVHSGLLVAHPVVLPLQTSLIVYAFRPGTTPQTARP